MMDFADPKPSPFKPRKRFPQKRPADILAAKLEVERQQAAKELENLDLGDLLPKGDW
jgi:hypothetical protein